VKAPGRQPAAAKIGIFQRALQVTQTAATLPPSDIAAMPAMGKTGRVRSVGL
jgi:hypothetical protein